MLKIVRPQPREAYARKRLFRLLDRARKRKLIWVAGPPGAGKTTLVASYLAQRRLPSLWYQVDAGDGDIATFFYYLGLAARKAAPRKRQPLPHLTPEYLSGLSVFTRQYFTELYRRLKRPAVLVFDNYQDAAHNTLLHDVMRDGLAVMPEGISVIIVSRSDPPPAFARLRADHAMTQIGWDELRLTEAESQGFARRQDRKRKGRSMKQAARRLHELAQGWAAGLVLLLEHNKNQDLPAEASAEFKPEAIFDYFAGEIFDKADAATQEFLLQSAFLPKITPRLAEQLTGQPQAGRIPADLHRKNYFTTKHADPAPFYQYHPLFRAFLMARANEIFTRERLVRVQQTAAKLLEGGGQTEDAMGLLREAGDWPELARLIGQHAPALLAQGRGQTLEAWLRSLPPEILEQTPWLLYWLGACRLSFNLAEARECFGKAFGLFDAENNPAGLFLAWSGVVDTFIYEWGDFTAADPWIARLDDLLDRYPEFPSVEIETRVAASMFGILVYRQPQHPNISAWEERTQALALKCPDIGQRMMIGNHLIGYYLWMGRYAKAALVIDALRKASHSQTIAPLTLTMWRSMEAAYYWFTASHEACLRAVTEGLETGQATGVHLWDFLLFGHGVWGSLIPGDYAATAEFLHKMTAVMDGAHRLDVAHYHHLAGLDATCRGDLPRAVEHLQTAVRLAREAGAPFPEAVCRIGLAQALFEQDDHRGAVAQLATARQAGRDMRCVLIEYQGLLLEALFALGSENEPQGLMSLRQAMVLGKTQGYMNDPWWVPSIMTRLCVKALEHGIEVEYVQALIRKRRLKPDEPPLALDAWPWPLKIYTLGRFSVVKDGKPLELTARSQRKPLELLMALIALGGRGVSQTKLTEALWPEVEGHLAQQTFEVTLHRLRKLIGDDAALVLKDGKLSLDPHRCWIDSWACEHLLSRIERVLHGTEVRPDDIDRSAKKLLALYQGPLLATETEQPWVLSPRERLRSKFLRQLGALGRRWETHDKWDQAVNGYLQGLEVDPLAEEFYRSLMRCYRRQRRPAEACAVYERCRKTLQAILNIAPSPETEALRRAIDADQAKRS